MIYKNEITQKKEVTLKDLKKLLAYPYCKK